MGVGYPLQLFSITFVIIYELLVVKVKGRIIIKKYILLLTSSVLLMNLIVGCQQKSEPPSPHSASNSATSANISTSNKPIVAESSIVSKNNLTDSITVDSVSEEPAIRAEQQTDTGTLLMISKGTEERGHLLVSSNLGQEGDQTFYSNYSVVYRHEDTDKVLLELPDFLYITPTDKKLPFEQVSFKDADVYILTPQNRTGFGVEGFVFAIDKESGDAFPLEIVENDKSNKVLLYSEGNSLPTVEDETLIVHPPIRAGTSEEDSADIHYKLDLKNKQLVAQ